MLRHSFYEQIRYEIHDKLLSLNQFENSLNPNVIKTVKDLLPFAKITQLRKILENDVLNLNNLARKSYFHENSFYKLTLMDTPDDKFRLRLHFWTLQNSCSSQPQNIHNHRFNYYSYILKGSLVNRVWNVVSNGNEFHYYKYFPRLKKEFYTLDYCGKFSLDICDEKKHSTGELYCMKAEDLHTAEVTNNINLITLFIEERSNLRPYADVFSNNYSLEKIPITSPSLKPNEYLRILDIIINILKS